MRRVRAALIATPSIADWRFLLLDMLWLAPVLAVFGWIGGFVHPTPTVEPLALARFALIAFFVPALAEEVVFRAVLLPPPSARPTLLRRAVAVAAFVAWHPLQVLWFGQEWGVVVLNPWFLMAVAALGTATTRLYLRTGSLWPAIVLHWVVVVAWKALGGASPWG